MTDDLCNRPYTEFLVIEDDTPQFSPLHYTAQTEHGRASKFCMVGPLHNTLITSEAIFDMSPLSRARGVNQKK